MRDLRILGDETLAISSARDLRHEGVIGGLWGVGNWKQNARRTFSAKAMKCDLMFRFMKR